MPRDSAGNYTLPTGNPVVSGTTIESAWANTTMTDVASEITNSLDRNGRGGMLAPFKFADGTGGAPGFSWVNETTLGFYRAGAGDMRGVVGGADKIRLVAAGLQVWDGAAWQNVVDEGQAVTFGSRPAFDGGTSGVDSPFTVDSTFQVDNLNAEFLGGDPNSSFAQMGRAQTILATWTFQTNPIVKAGSGSSGVLFRPTSDAGAIQNGLFFQNAAGSVNHWQMVYQSNDGTLSIRRNDGSVIMTADATTGVWNWVAAPTINSNEIWHAGNDGGGSGLDADTLDGLQGSAYGALADAETVTGIWNFSNGIQSQGNNLGRRLIQIDIYTSSGSHTWTKPAGTTAVEVFVVGGGGGSGGADLTGGNDISVASSGGGGAFGYSWITAGLGTTEDVVVGTGGAGGGVGTSGSAGLQSKFGTSAKVTANGGGAGTGNVLGNVDMSSLNGGAGGAATIFSGVGFTIRGEDGNPSMAFHGVPGATARDMFYMGAGGNSGGGWGVGGKGQALNTDGSVNIAGSVGWGYGAGGSGAFCTNTTGAAGAQGTSGIVIVKSYTNLA